MLFEPVNLKDQKARIVVIGVGGAGNNALNRMIQDGMKNVDFIAINTDAQDLDQNNSQIKLQIGKELTKGLGAGADYDIGKQAVGEAKETIIKHINSADMVFITAGMGGGTGTGAAPEIAKISKELGALTVGIVTKPFAFEGPHRLNRASIGIQEMKKNCDTLLIIPNEVLLELADENTAVTDSFKFADSVLHQAAQGISDVINRPGLINLDFADVKTVMQNMGDALMGTGNAYGDERAILAAQSAINSPLLQNTTISGADGLLINITGPSDMTTYELNQATEIIFEESGQKSNVFLGCVIDDELKDEVRITVIATGLNSDKEIDYETKTENIFNSDNKTNVTRKNDYNNHSNIDFSNDKKEEIKEDPIITFGEDTDPNDLDIPTYLRGRN